MTHDDDRLDEAVRRLIRELDPPPTPREELWARIQAERAATAGRSADRQAADAIELRPRRRAWLAWGAALAAMLVIGIGLGRVSLREAGLTAPSSTAAAADPADVVPTAYRLAASRHLERTEALFSSLAVDARTQGPGEVSGWARELLTDTRLLIGSPAALDPALGRLLEDLELVLSQIAAIPSARAQEEVELIQDGINQSDVLLRMRAATAGPAFVGT